MAPPDARGQRASAAIPVPPVANRCRAARGAGARSRPPRPPSRHRPGARAARLCGLALLAAAALAACATPARRVERALLAEGVPPAMARCLGEQLDERLDAGQLRRLGQLAARVAQVDMRTLSLAELDRLARELGDPVLLRAALGSGLACLTRR